MHEIVHELTIAAAPAAVYAAVTTPEGLAHWWTSDCEVAPEVGTVATFRFDDGATELGMRIDLLEAPELVHWECIKGPGEWEGTTIAFRIEAADPDAGGDAGPTVVRFWHGGWPYPDGDLPRCSFRWAMHLDALRRFLEGEPATPGS